MSLQDEIAKPAAAPGDTAAAPPARRSRSPAGQGRKIVFTIAEADYQKIALWCYERGKRVEQVAEELLLAKFAE
jgi:hypothetical protein